MQNSPNAVMLFAAGLGTRMGALTANKPKPLISVGGKTLLDHALTQVNNAGVSSVVINTHYHASQIENHVRNLAEVKISAETDMILETGGGLRAALPLLGDGPVFTLNTDAVWTGKNPLKALAQAWDGEKMDALLLLAPPSQIVGFHGAGDFIINPEGRIERAQGRPGLAYLGAQIILPIGIEKFKQHAFSLNLLWDQMIEDGRAFGVLHQGGWCDVGRPEGIAEAENLLGIHNVL